MVERNLKETHPQKYYLKLVSRILFYMGLGTYWYEDLGFQNPRLYALWSFIFNSYVVGVTLNVISAYKRSDLKEEQMEEIIEFGYGQALIIVKLFLMILQRHRIQKVFKTLLEKHRDIFTSLELERQSVVKAKRFLYPIIIGTYSYLTLTVAKWILVSFRDGKPLKTLTVYYPTANDTGFLFSILRFFIICHWWLIIAIMTACDCLCFLCLLFIGSKFKLVQLYFESLRDKFEGDWNLEDFQEAVVSGIKLHQNALWCARNVQDAIGNIFSAQICETIVLLGIYLVKVVSLERTFANLIAAMLYIFCISLLTACYMITSGDITHEAAAVATSMFHCGWERARGDASSRLRLAVAMHQAQRPVCMTAFGVLELSYESFIRVLRTAYSFFAIVYSRN